MTVLLQIDGKSKDTTTKDVKPDFEGEKFHHWQHMIRHHEDAVTHGQPHGTLPHKERSSKAEQSFFKQVDRKMSQRVFVVGISFDKDGKIIRS